MADSSKKEVAKQFNFCQETIKLKNKIENSFLDLSARLKKIRDEEMWQGSYEDFADYCESGLKMDKTSAYKLIQIYEVLVLKYKVEPVRLAEIGWSRLSMVVPLVDPESTTAAKVNKMIDEAASARSRSELKKTFRQEKTGIDPTKCPHPADDCYNVTMTCCRRCGEQWHEPSDN